MRRHCRGGPRGKSIQTGWTISAIIGFENGYTADSLARTKGVRFPTSDHSGIQNSLCSSPAVAGYASRISNQNPSRQSTAGKYVGESGYSIPLAVIGEEELTKERETRRCEQPIVFMASSWWVKSRPSIFLVQGINAASGASKCPFQRPNKSPKTATNT